MGIEGDVVSCLYEIVLAKAFSIIYRHFPVGTRYPMSYDYALANYRKQRNRDGLNKEKEPQPAVGINVYQ